MNIESLRNDTSGCHDKLFFNSAGSSLVPASVNTKIKEYLDDEEMYGGYRLAEKRKGEIAGFYQEIALLLNTSADNIAFTSSATDAFARALSAFHFEAGDVILTTEQDYVSSFLQFLTLKERFGIQIERVRSMDNGDLDLEHMKTLLATHSPKLFTMAHVPTSSGLVQDAEGAGELCAMHNCYFLLDACQSAGQLPLDVNKIKCHFLSATGRKFLRGPRGTGFLYVADHVLNDEMAPLFIDLAGATWTGPESYELASNARRFEQWENPYALMMGLKEAVGYANNLGLENIERRNTELGSYLRNGLQSVRDVSVYDRGSRRSAIITFLKLGKSIPEHIHLLQSNNVYYSVTSRDSAIFDYTAKGVEKLIRLSPHYFNTKEEIDDLLEIVDQI